MLRTLIEKTFAVIRLIILLPIVPIGLIVGLYWGAFKFWFDAGAEVGGN